MADEQKAIDGSNAVLLDSPAMQDKSVNGYAFLARRITGITSNLLFTAIVLVAGLGIGRQIIHWWAADEPKQLAAPQSSDIVRELGNADELHFLQFGGQSWSLARREVHGSREQAEKQLQRDCREQIAQAEPLPKKSASEQQSLLASLAKTTPLDEELPHWQLYSLRDNRLILVGVKPPLAKDDGARPSWPPESGRDARAPETSEAVLWGIALPKGEKEWSELLFLPSHGGNNAIPLLTDITLPSKCRKMLTVQAVNGGAMVTFSGQGKPEDWRGHFERLFTKMGWNPVFHWQMSGSAWYAQYRGQNKDKNITVDVHFYPDDKGGMTGLLVVGEGEARK
jgi:hypothetical protein